jgi:hypothetical protein
MDAGADARRVGSKRVYRPCFTLRQSVHFRQFSQSAESAVLAEFVSRLSNQPGDGASISEHRRSAYTADNGAHDLLPPIPVPKIQVAATREDERAANEPSNGAREVLRHRSTSHIRPAPVRAGLSRLRASSFSLLARSAIIDLQFGHFPARY